MTKIELLEVIENKNNELRELHDQLDKLKKYEKYEEMADEFGAMKQAFMNSGFSDEQAFQLLREMIKPVIEQTLMTMRF